MREGIQYSYVSSVLKAVFARRCLYCSTKTWITPALVLICRCVSITIHLSCTEAEFWGEIQTKVWRVFLLACYSQSKSIALHWDFYFFKVTQPLTVSRVTGSIVKEKRRKTWWKTIPPSLWFKKSIQKPQVWELSRLWLESSTKLYVHEFGFSTKQEENMLRKLSSSITISPKNIRLLASLQ